MPIPAHSRTPRPQRLALALALALPLLAAGSLRGLDDIALERVAGGFKLPVFVIGDPSQLDRLFVVELRGVIRLTVDGIPNRRAFLNIKSRVAPITDPDEEEFGLFSMAFDPGWPKKRFVYVNYTNLSGDTVISRFKTNKKRTKAKPGSEIQMLVVEQPHTWHNGGQIQIGPDKHLYIGMGDGGDDLDRGWAGQDLTPFGEGGPVQLLGKLLRFKIAGKQLKVPQDNPTLPEVGRTAIWSIGLRNPWRFSFDRKTGDLYIGDVGEESREEIDFQKAGSKGGRNYGWARLEGSLPFNLNTRLATPKLIKPIYEYDHAQGQSVTGGYVYRGKAIPSLTGYYVFADWGSARIWAFRQVKGKAKDVVELSSMLRNEKGKTPTVVSFGEDAEGELYVCDFFEGVIYRVVSIN